MQRQAAYYTLLGKLLAVLTLTMSAFTFAVAESRAEPATMANWVVDTHNGERLSLYQELEQGRKVVMIFWATWCRFCRELLPQLDKIHKSGEHDNATFVAMNIWEDSNPLEYMARKGISLPTVLRAESIARNYRITGTPGVIVIGKGHQILFQRRAGQSTEQTLQGVITALETP